MNTYKSNFKTVLLLCIALFIAYKFLPVKQYRQITGKEVDLWKQELKQAYFKGEVISINVPDNESKLARTIYLKVMDTARLTIPDSCEYLKFKKGILLLTAANINISTGPYHEINTGDIITKFKNTDSVCVYTDYGCCKFYFPLFDGLGSEKVRMEITGKSPCY